MLVILIGSSPERAGLRAHLPSDVEVVGEAATMTGARSLHVAADAWLVVPPQTLDLDEDDGVPEEALTRREQDVLALMAEGLSNRRIGERLGISDQTVKFHVAAVCGKLRAANRTGAVRIGIARGLVAL